MLFRSPGTVLQLLEGPVMTPGGFNEFRFLDENQTIPINVPVTAGQNFYIALEFFNPTNVGGGGPSVVRDVDGCQAGRNVLFAPGLGGWLNFCTFLAGDLAIRAVVDCQDATGACCDVNALCSNDVGEGDCQGPGETFFLGETCATITCPTPVGACCNGAGGCFSDQTQDFCENTLSSIYAGNGTTCESQICDVGACCLPDGSCQDVIDQVCTGLGGVFNGPGSDCASANCPQPGGACCVGETCVADQTEANCAAFDGTWQGPLSTCAPNPCAAGCNSTAVCPNADVNCDNIVNTIDIGIISSSANFGLSAGAASEPRADVNGDGIINTIDIGVASSSACFGM